MPLKFSSTPRPSSLHAKKPKKAGGSGGGGFGASKPTGAPSVATISADIASLERQWDNFVSITDLEIQPKGHPEDEDYRHFIVSDVFVRVGSENESESTGWYRTGKVVAADETDVHAALTLQKGLIFWSALHMWPALAAKGKAAARNLRLGYMPPSMTMADETDATLDAEEAEDVLISEKVSVRGVSAKDVGFRPDFNPPGFTYKRREKAAMKKKKSSLEEIVEAS